MYGLSQPSEVHCEAPSNDHKKVSVFKFPIPKNPGESSFKLKR